jgi:hypothetical protein
MLSRTHQRWLRRLIMLVLSGSSGRLYRTAGPVGAGGGCSARRNERQTRPCEARGQQSCPAAGGSASVLGPRGPERRSAFMVPRASRIVGIMAHTKVVATWAKLIPV